MPNLLILGAGGFGHMVYESAMATRQFDKIAMLDDACKESCVIGKLVDYKEFRKEYPVRWPLSATTRCGCTG